MKNKTFLGNSDIEINPLGLGCMGMSEFYGKSDDQESLKILESAFDLGIDYYDTADTYGLGHNERLLSSFIKNKRNKIKVGSKFGIVREQGQYERTIDNSPQYIKLALEKSLKNLNTDYLDLYFVHRFDQNANLEETMLALKKLKDEGKILSVGVSELSAKSLKIAHQICPIDVVQTEYSLMTRDVEEEILPLCKTLGISFMAYSPLGRGLLTGGIPSRDKLASDDLRLHLPRFQTQSMIENEKLIHVLADMALKYKCTSGQLAMAWLLSQYEKMILIPGTRKESRLKENFECQNVKIDKNDINVLSETFKNGQIAGDRYLSSGMMGINV